MKSPVDLGSLRIRQLRYLVEVAHQESFSDAADQIGVSQSAISQGLARLSDQLGIALFEADGRNRRLNAAGREVADSAARLLSEALSLERYVSDRAGGVGGTLRVGMIDAAALYLLPNAVEQARSSGTSLQLVVDDSAGLAARLKRYEIDLAFVVGPEPTFDWVAVATERLHAYRPIGVTTTGWVLYPTGSRTRAAIDEAMGVARKRRVVAAESGNPAVLAQLCALGMGATVLPERVGDSHPQLERLDDSIVSREIVAAFRPGLRQDRVASRFLDLATSDG